MQLQQRDERKCSPRSLDTMPLRVEVNVAGGWLVSASAGGAWSTSGRYLGRAATTGSSLTLATSTTTSFGEWQERALTLDTGEHLRICREEAAPGERGASPLPEDAAAAGLGSGLHGGITIGSFTTVLPCPGAFGIKFGALWPVVKHIETGTCRSPS